MQNRIIPRFFRRPNTDPVPPSHRGCAIVTGGTRGIGAAISRKLGADGYAVVVGYHTHSEEAASLCEEITAGGGAALPLAVDVTREADVAALIDFAVAQFGGLDVLVNNAGISPTQMLETTDTTHIEMVFAINVRGVLLASKHASRVFGERGGAIINTSSIWGAAPHPGAAVYSASKAAVNAITISLARELGPRQIRVNAVAPGLIITERTGRDLPEETLHAVSEVTPLRRLGQPDDVASVVAFLASDEARWVTGQILTASGGV